MSAATASVSARGWILADFDDTLAPDDSHAGLLRFILRRRIWPLLLWPLMAFGAVIYLLPDSLTRPGLYREARALLTGEGHRCWVISASPRALVRAQLHRQLPRLPHRIIGSRMGYRFGGLVPRFYCHGRHKLLPELLTLEAALTLSDSLHDLPLLALGEQAWLINPALRDANERSARLGL